MDAGINVAPRGLDRGQRETEPGGEIVIRQPLQRALKQPLLRA